MPLTRLSSRLTFLYKVIIPVVTMLLWLGYVGLVVSQQWNLELHLLAAGFLLLLWLLFVATAAARIRYICYDADTVRIRNYGPWHTLPATAIVDFDTSLLMPLRLLRTSTSNYYFLPSAQETFGALRDQNPLFGLVEPASIVRARAVLGVSAAPSTR